MYIVGLGIALVAAIVVVAYTKRWHASDVDKMKKKMDDIEKDIKDKSLQEECIVIHGPNSDFAKRPTMVVDGKTVDINKEMFKNISKEKLS